jgi:hypothetical protein
MIALTWRFDIDRLRFEEQAADGAAETGIRRNDAESKAKLRTHGRCEGYDITVGELFALTQDEFERFHAKGPMATQECENWITGPSA